LLAWEYAVALMRVTLSVFQGSTEGAGFIISKTRSGGFDGATTDGMSQQGVSSRIHTALIARRDTAQYPVIEYCSG